MSEADAGRRGRDKAEELSNAGQTDPPLQTQAEVDYYWEKLSDGGQPGRCAWLKDRAGVSWQVVPTALIELMQDKDAAKSARVMKAMLAMSKIDIAGLRRAYEGIAA